MCHHVSLHSENRYNSYENRLPLQKPKTAYCTVYSTSTGARNGILYFGGVQSIPIIIFHSQFAMFRMRAGGGYFTPYNAVDTYRFVACMSATFIFIRFAPANECARIVENGFCRRTNHTSSVIMYRYCFMQMANDEERCSWIADEPTSSSSSSSLVLHHSIGICKKGIDDHVGPEESYR